MVIPFDNIATTTLQLIRKRLADNIFKANPLAAWLLMRGRVQIENGGKSIWEPLMYATNSTVASYVGYDKLNVAPTEELTVAEFFWRQAAASVSISGLEEIKNNGTSTQIFNLLKAKMMNAEMSLRQFLAEKLLAVSTSKDTTRDFLGLDELVEDALAASQGTVGGIVRSVETWWANQYTDNDTAWTTQGVLNDAMNKMYNDVSKGLTQPDLLLTDQTTYEHYENDNREKLRFSDTSLLDIGFVNTKFKGATLMWDENVQDPDGAGTDHLVYFLNSEFLRLVIHAQRNFVITPFRSPIDQDARVAQILLAGNMTTNNSRHQGVLRVSEA